MRMKITSKNNHLIDIRYKVLGKPSLDVFYTTVKEIEDDIRCKVYFRIDQKTDQFFSYILKDQVLNFLEKRINQ